MSTGAKADFNFYYCNARCRSVDDTFHEIVDRARTSHGAFNKPRSILDLYTPRFVKGVSAQKVGMCPVW